MRVTQAVKCTLPIDVIANFYFRPSLIRVKRLSRPHEEFDGAVYQRSNAMKLLHIPVAVVLSATFVVPAFARCMCMDAAAEALQSMQQEAAQAGATDEAHAAYWNRMKPEQQAHWYQHCMYTSSDVRLAQNDTPERQAFCKAIRGQ